MGGNDLLGNKRQVSDQGIQGARPLLACLALGVPVRLVRKNAEPSSFTGSLFVYDGLWDVVGGGRAGGGGAGGETGEGAACGDQFVGCGGWSGEEEEGCGRRLLQQLPEE
jgi:hypothetical protein